MTTKKISTRKYEPVNCTIQPIRVGTITPAILRLRTYFQASTPASMVPTPAITHATNELKLYANTY
jgi:hypothetical protein